MPEDRVAEDAGFESWWERAPVPEGFTSHMDTARSAFAAGAASRQGEVDRLKAEIQRRQEEEVELVGLLAHLNYDLDETPMDTLRRLVKEQIRG